MRPNIRLLTVFLCLGWMLGGLAAAPASLPRVKFAGSGPGAGFAALASPLRGIYQYTNVNSKYNQPRAIRGGSNPHQGIDLDTGGKGELIYAPGRGMVTRASAGSGGNRIMVIQLDWNNDGQLDNLFMTYMHLSYFLVGKGDWVDANTAVALSGGSGGYDPHLHFEINTDYDYSATGEGISWVSLPAYPYYRGMRQWNGGRDLDFICDVRWRDNRYLEAVVYANDEEGYHPVPAGEVVFFYRTTTGSTWQGPVSLNKNGDRFAYDLAALNLPSGTNLDFFLRASRDDRRPAYNYSFYPPKYYRPAPVPGPADLPYEFLSIRYD